MRLKLEVFEPAGPAAADAAAQEAMEELRLGAFEKGYAAGWDDAAAAEAKAQQRLRSEIAHQFQELAFTFHEARHALLREIEPVLFAMATVVIPRAARETLAPLVADAIAEVADRVTDHPVVLRVCPEDAEALAAVVQAHAQAAIELIPDDTLAPGQVWIRAPDREAVIDTSEACRRIQGALQGFFHSEPEVRQHG